MAGIKLVYIGGGSTRAPGTVAALVERGAAFAGSEVVLVDLDIERLDVVRRLAEGMAAARGHDIRFRATTQRTEALGDADVVLTSFRPGGFGAEPFAVSFTGGLARADVTTLLGAAAVGLMGSEGLRPTPVPPRWQPALGALVIGLQSDGVISQGVAARLDATQPPPSLYDVLSP